MKAEYWVRKLAMEEHPEGGYFRQTYWFTASVASPKSYSLVGCKVAPGFEYQDGELVDRETLLKEYPRHRKIIEKYTK